MLRQFTVIAALVATALSVGDAAHYSLKVVQAATASDATTADSTATVKANTWHMKPVTSVQARVQGDAPVYDATAKIWVSSRGKTLEEQYRSVLDTVNTASVEGALMYVQAETINVKEQSVECERKNKVQNVVFYELTILQPTYALAAYPTSSTPEYTPYLAMDGGKCTNEKDSLPKACKQLYGLDGELALGASVGAESKKSDPRAPYPGNYWFSFPNSCADQPWANKTDECRKTHAGGLCPVGTQPDGDTCSFAYKILGYIKIDDLVGITALKENKYASYAEFCKDGGIEFSATNTASTGFTDVESLPFWEKPGDETANAERAAKMVKMYNELAPKATAAGGPMIALPTVADLVARNPKCYENVEACATAKNGCRRTLLAQLCEVCTTAGDGCEVAPTDFKFPTLVSATLAPTVAPTANSTTEPGTSGSPTPAPASSGAAGAARAFATSFASVAVAVGVAAVALL